MAKQPTQFRVTQEMVDAAIKGKPTFTRLPSGKAIICELTLQNGFTVRGESSVVDPRNFVLKTGKEISLKNATDKVWAVLAYGVQSDLHASQAAAPRARKTATKKAAAKKAPAKRAVRRRKPTTSAE